MCLHSACSRRKTKTKHRTFTLVFNHVIGDVQKQVFCLAGVSWHTLIHTRPLFVRSSIFFLFLAYTKSKNMTLWWIYYILLNPCLVNKKKIVFCLSTLKHVIFFYKYWIFSVCTNQYNYIHIHSLNMSAECWNELKPVHSHNIIHVNDILFFYSTPLLVNVSM